MSKIEKLIERLCPDGVEYKELEKICHFQNGFSFKSNLFKDSGEPILRITNITDGKLSDDSYVYFDLEDYKENLDNYKVKKGDVVVAMSGATTGKIGYNYSDNIYYLNQRVGLFIPNEKVLLKRFLYHWLTMQSQNIYNISSGSGAQPNLSSVKMMKFRIPVPPLEVQCEIVHILDDFTLLSAELSAELKARQEQFSYYREKLYKSNENIKRLDEVVDIRLGLTHTPKYVENGIKFISAQNTSNDYLNLENVKYISQKEYDSITDNAKPKRGDILFTRVGSNLGHPVIVETDEKLCMFVSLGYLRIKNTNSVLNTYIKHWINTENFWSQVRKNVHGSAKVNLNTGWLSKFEISIPSIEEQQNIVNILDKLEKLCNDISEGLPAEIEARKKQYEYYRDKLLTFKELKVNE